MPRHEAGQFLADHRRAPESATDQYPETDIAGVVVAHFQADVVGLDEGPVMGGTVDGDLELSRQIGELGVEGAPLAQDLAPWPRVDALVGGDTCERIGRDVADATARGLDRVHLHAGQFGEDVRSGFDRRPVELDVLARREVSVAAIIGACDVRELAQLAARQQAVWNGDAQHRCVPLDVEPVLQS